MRTALPLATVTALVVCAVALSGCAAMGGNGSAEPESAAAGFLLAVATGDTDGASQLAGASLKSSALDAARQSFFGRSASFEPSAVKVAPLEIGAIQMPGATQEVRAYQVVSVGSAPDDVVLPDPNLIQQPAVFVTRKNGRWFVLGGY
jgi:hypothetical protein